MKKTKILTFALLTFAAVVSANPFALVNPTFTPPKIDGVETPREWDGAIELAGFSKTGTLEYAKEQTSLKLLSDGKYLYGIIRAQQAGADKLWGVHAKDDPGLWNDNGVEIFFFGQNKQLCQIVVNLFGTVTDYLYKDFESGKTGDISWNAGLDTGASRDSKQWCVEFRVLLASLPFSKEGTVKFNIARNNKEAREYSSWSPLAEHSWQQTAQYGVLKLGEKAETGVAFLEFPTGKPGDNLRFRASNARAVLTYGDQTVRGGVNEHGECVVKVGNHAGQRRVEIEIISTSGQKLYYNEHRPRGNVIEVFGDWGLAGKTLYISAGIDCGMTFTSFHTLPNPDPKLGNRVKVDYDIMFDMPEGVTVIGGKRAGFSQYGKGRYLASLPMNYAYSTYGWCGAKFSTILPESSKGDIYYYVKWKEWIQPNQKIDFEVVNVNEVAAPKRFVTGFYAAQVNTLEKARFLRKYGFNTVHYLGMDAEFVKELRKDGFYVVRGGFWWPGGINTYAIWPKQDRASRAMDIDGNYIINRYTGAPQISPSYRGKLFQEAVTLERRFAKESGINFYSMDMEDCVIPNGKTACFNPESLRRHKLWFEEKYPELKYIDPRVTERTLEKYPEYHSAWIKFKDFIFGDFFNEFKRQVADSIVSNSMPAPWDKGPHLCEWVFCELDNVKTIENNMKGPEFVKAIGTFEFDAYSCADRAIRQMVEQRRQIKKYLQGTKIHRIFCPSPSRLGIGNQNDFYYSPNPPLKFERKYMIFNAAAYGMRGMVIYRYPRMNALAWRNVGDALTVINKIEDIVLDGEPVENISCDQPLGLAKEVSLGPEHKLFNQPKVFVLGMKKDKKTIFTVSEYLDLRPMNVTVSLLVPRTAVLTDVETDEKIADLRAGTKSFKVSLDNRRCRMFMIEEK